MLVSVVVPVVLDVVDEVVLSVVVSVAVPVVLTVVEDELVRVVVPVVDEVVDTVEVDVVLSVVDAVLDTVLLTVEVAVEKSDSNRSAANEYSEFTGIINSPACTICCKYCSACLKVILLGPSGEKFCTKKCT